MASLFTMSVDCTGLTTEASSSTQSADLTTQAIDSSRSPTLSSSPSLNNRPSAQDKSPSSSASPAILTDSASLSTRHTATLSTSFTPQPSATQSGSGSKNTDSSNNNLSKEGQIAIGVVVPVLGLIAALVFGIRTWNKIVPVDKRLSLPGSSAGREAKRPRNATTNEQQTRRETFQHPPHRPEVQSPPKAHPWWDWV